MAATESRLPTRRQVPYLPLLFDNGWVDKEIIRHPYPGSGTEDDPFIIGWTPNDPRDPMQFSPAIRWAWTGLVSLATFAVALATSELVFELGLSAFILGFAIGPVIWGPLSELHGRRNVFLSTYLAFTLLIMGCALAPTIQGLVVMQFLAGAFGSSPLTIAGDILANIWPNEQRGLAMIFFSSAPLFGPSLGPVIGGFIGTDGGWRWVLGFLAILGGVCCVAMTSLIPETFAPALLNHRAERLSRTENRAYVSKLVKNRPKKTLRAAIQEAFVRPWALLIYMAILSVLRCVFLYLFFAAFPIVYQEYRGWGQDMGGLAFLGLAAGIAFGILVAIYATIRSTKSSKLDEEEAWSPEIRLPMSLGGCVAIPVGLFWFAWTNDTSFHWLVSVVAQVPFGFGFVLVYISIQNYLVDAYTIYSASVLAANAMLRSIFGAAFPLFTSVSVPYSIIMTCPRYGVTLSPRRGSANTNLLVASNTTYSTCIVGSEFTGQAPAYHFHSSSIGMVSIYDRNAALQLKQLDVHMS
ncbi:major facilitator superfamily domain-containing protein [Apiospora phragmitis]|uniref:Major facilitator superfamily domain-containing protein n=1 Tax=Apiospora phragmitis TaxID=2905665 RepID=A0ABR1U6T5_9PEZI